MHPSHWHLSGEKPRHLSVVRFQPSGWPQAWVTEYRHAHPVADRWAASDVLVHHSVETQDRVFRMAQQLALRGCCRAPDMFHVLRAADEVAADALRLVSHDVDARAIVPAYAGFLAMNVITGEPRAWVVSGRGAAAMQVVNRVLDGRTLDHPPEDPSSDESLLRDPRAQSPWRPRVVRRGVIVFSGDAGRDEGWLASVARRRSWTAGIVFTTDPWLGQTAQERRDALGVFRRNGLDPIVIDGADPAAFAWAIYEIECRLEDMTEAARGGDHRVPVPFGVAVASQGDSAPLPARVA